MKRRWIVVSALFVVIIVGFLALAFIPVPKVVDSPMTPAVNTTSIPDVISVSAPVKNTKVSSPLIIRGTARGTFYFEGTFPVELTDASGKVIAQGAATAESSWTTTDFVPFTSTLSFTPQPAGSSGTLVLTNDNPSGDPAKEKEVDIPLKF